MKREGVKNKVLSAICSVLFLFFAVYSVGYGIGKALYYFFN